MLTCKYVECIYHNELKERKYDNLTELLVYLLSHSKRKKKNNFNQFQIFGRNIGGL